MQVAALIQPATPVSVAPARVLILGLGESGLAAARWYARACAQVTVADTRGAPPQLEQLRLECPDAQFVTGTLGVGLLDGIDAVIRSPGLKPLETAALRSACYERGIAWLAELEVFMAALADLKSSQQYAPKLVAITGTNGKTTVTQLCGVLAKRAGSSVCVAGNVSPAMLDALRVALDAGQLPGLWVLELSSFQLDDVSQFEPTAAVLLNLSQDHLDWHGSLQAYAQAKSRVFGSALTTLRVAYRQDAAVMQLAVSGLQKSSGQKSSLQKSAKSSRDVKEAPLPATLITFGTDLPQRVGDFGIESVGGLDWLVQALGDDTVRRKKEAAGDLTYKRLMPADALHIRGRHNACNALAALCLLSAAGLPLAPMLHGLREYRGEPHRVELVATVAGVEYFDDSKGTNVGATVAALSGLQRTVVLIAGGLGKGQDFTPLAGPVAAHARAVLLIGADARVIELALQETGVPLIACTSLQEAVTQAATLAQAGDAVLLSPACASFDMFNGYEHRAAVFVAAVNSLVEVSA